MRTWAMLLTLCATVNPAAGGPLEAEPEDLRPGLLAAYRSQGDREATISRIEPKPTFYLGDSSPHPRIPPGPFEVVWTGVIHLQDRGPLTFSAFVGGELKVEIDGVPVIEGKGMHEKAKLVSNHKLDREPGHYRLTIHYRSLKDVPARLQLFWEGPSFPSEPVPAWRFSHFPKELPATAREDQMAAQGKAAVGQFGCARCHHAAFPGVSDPPPGPSLTDIGSRVSRDWLMQWLADPAKVRPEARMPALFSGDRKGYVERWIIADFLCATAKPQVGVGGDHRAGRLAFVKTGCAACHLVPDVDLKEQPVLGRTNLTGLAERFRPDDLAAFIVNPHGRYPDGRMPRLLVNATDARHIAAYLLLWSKPTAPADAQAPSAEEIGDAVRRIGARDQATAATTLLHDKGCLSCHTLMGVSFPMDVPIKDAAAGCLSRKNGPRFAVDDAMRKGVTGYLKVAAQERHPSPFAKRQEKLARAGCVHCHQRDSDRPSRLEEIGSTLGGAFLQEVPFQRTPRLTNVLQKYTRSHVLSAVRDGVTGLRTERFSYRMPHYGEQAAELVQALAEADGELPNEPDAPLPKAADPTAATLAGPVLVGSQGYSCISCHSWNGKHLTASDPGAAGPDLTRVAGRIRRDWFERFLDGPARSHPSTPMPTIFERGKPAQLTSILDGDAAKQKDALWHYFALGKEAPSPKAPPPVPVAAPGNREPALVAQIPIRLPDDSVVESICVLTNEYDLLIYDLAAMSPHSFRAGSQILRTVEGRHRRFLASDSGAPLLPKGNVWRLIAGGKAEAPTERTIVNCDRLNDGVRIRWKLHFPSGAVQVDERLRITEGPRRLTRDLELRGVPKGALLELRAHALFDECIVATPNQGTLRSRKDANDTVFSLSPAERNLSVVVSYDVGRPRSPPEFTSKVLVDEGRVEGSLERPGYKAAAFPRPKTVAGEDRIMPGAIAVDGDGRLFVASMKTGELFVFPDPRGKTFDELGFKRYGNTLFQDALSMMAERDGLYILHRRNLTRIVNTPDNEVQLLSPLLKPTDPLRLERVFALPHGVADTYDYAYGLAKHPKGGFVISYAPYADAKMSGAGGALRLYGEKTEEIAYGFRNPLGWCNGPDDEVFFTDNQGDWVATNKLCHLVPGRFYGWPNQSQKQHHSKPAGKAAVWVPYGWARSINGVAYDNTGGKFGPFAGQFFMAELMYGGGIIRANVEKVNGEYQGACFPFWGKGLLGPVCLAFDKNRGHLYVGGITEPGWMAQPDRGAVFRIDYTGKNAFEMKSIHVLPRGFRIVFTTPLDKVKAADAAAYHLEHYRYEYTGAYGSPEYDRTQVKVEKAVVAEDGLSVELTTKVALVKDRVYLISPNGVRSAKGQAALHTTGAYTLNEIPNKVK